VSAMTTPVIIRVDNDRVTLHLGGYEFEVVVRETSTAESTADLLWRQVTALVRTVAQPPQTAGS